ncbi:MAG: signal transduction histidine kinase, partial [Herminiimonas sp.]|nr:signal transduction histidine kinase [Herminiimonas sp.]
MLSKPFSTLEDPIGKSLARQLAGKDSEVWFATLRCGVLLAGLVCLMAVTHVGSHPDRWLWSLRLTAGLFLLGAIGILVAFARLPKRRRYHLLVCVLLDIGSTGCLAFFIDYWAVPFYFLGLCLVMAYGFRYGTGIMLVALAVFALDFGTSALMQPRGMDGVPVGFLLLACMAFTAVFVQSHHVRLTRTHTHLQSEIDAHAEFIGVFGDELKTSVDALLGESRENPAKTRVPDLPQHARETVSCLLRPLPDDILDYCAVKRGTFALTTQDFNLFESVQRTLCSFRRHAPDRQKRISLQVEPTLSFALHGDERRLRRTMLHVLCDTLGGCDAGHFVVRLTGDIGSAGQVILREGIVRAGSACSSPANQNASLGRDRALPLRSASLAGRMAGHLASALGGELVRRPLTERRLVELAVPLGTQGARVRQGALHGMEALAIGFEEGSLMRLCTQLERWSAVTLSAVDLPSAREVLSGARRTNRQLSLILLHADALRSGSDGSDSGPDFARHVADATVLLRSWCEPCVSIVLSIQGQVR